jgi:hypothetical protein
MVPWFCEQSVFGTRGGSSLAALDHSQGIAPLAARLATQLVHERAHQKDAPAADPQFAGIQMGHRADIERFSLVKQLDLEALRYGLTFNLEPRADLSMMGVANDVVDRLMRRQDHGLCGLTVKSRKMTERFNKIAGKGDKAKVTGNSQAPGRVIRGHSFSPPDKLESGYAGRIADSDEV